MDIEERIYQSEFWGNDPEYPPNFPPVLFGGENHWENIKERILLGETTEVSSVYRKPKGFHEDFEEGFI